MTIEKLRPTFTFTEERLRELQVVVPEAFADGKINWEVLREALGAHLEDETQEHFGLTWPGKREARRLAALPPQGTLVPVPGEGVNEAATRNLFIEGENLEVLKLLQKSYAGRVKMIYIDPPYNTGNDFIYEDDFSEPLTTYLKRTGQMDDLGQMLTTNKKSSGRFHSLWLSMMYPRLLAARGLLRQDGAIFVSIDDNEFHNLKGIMDEVFGEENFVNAVSIKAKPSAGASGGGEDKRLKKNVEFLLIYAKDIGFDGDVLRFRDVYEETDLFEHISTMRSEDRSWKYTSVLLSRGERQSVCAIRDGSGNEIRVYEHKAFERTTINSLLKSSIPDTNRDEQEHDIYRTHLKDIFSDTNAQSSIRTRVIEALGEEDGLFSIDYVPVSGKNRGKLTTVYYIGKQKRQVIWLADIAYQQGNRVILKDKISTLWDDLNWNNVAREGGISFPNGKKPIAFIQRMVELTTTGEEEELILDFFSGSGSTGHAVFAANAKDNGNRRFILVQLPIQAKEAHQFSTIAELSKQRLRNAIDDFEPITRDLRGFRVYRFQRSNLKSWQTVANLNTQQLDYLLDQFGSSLVPDWQELDLLAEILLLEGFPLDSRQTQLAAVTANAIWRVHHPDVGHELTICLDATLAPATLVMLKAGTLVQGDNIFICLDSALSDEAKVVLDDRLRLKVI